MLRHVSVLGATPTSELVSVCDNLRSRLVRVKLLCVPTAPQGLVCVCVRVWWGGGKGGKGNQATAQLCEHLAYFRAAPHHNLRFTMTMQMAANSCFKPEIPEKKNARGAIFNKSKFPAPNAWRAIQNSQDFTSLGPRLNNRLCAEFTRKEKTSSDEKNTVFSKRQENVRTNSSVSLFSSLKLSCLAREDGIQSSALPAQRQRRRAQGKQAGPPTGELTGHPKMSSPDAEGQEDTTEGWGLAETASAQGGPTAGSRPGPGPDSGPEFPSAPRTSDAKIPTGTPETAKKQPDT